MKNIAYLLLVSLIYSISISPCFKDDDDCCEEETIEVIVLASNDFEGEACSVLCLEECCQTQWLICHHLKMQHIKNIDILFSSQQKIPKEPSDFSIWQPPRFLS